MQMFLRYVLNSVFSPGAVNPIKILGLFISMTVLSVFLDELGFFKVLANAALKKAGQSRKKLFYLLYTTVSVLTVFTSNDIIVLTFTPFICYFSSSAKINPIPYLFTVFVAANTWSMALIIGNPTNIYLASSLGIDFFVYLRTMILPTAAAGFASFILLQFCFENEFKQKMSVGITPAGHITSPFLLIVGILHLALCTLALSVSSFLGVEMWQVSVLCVLSLALWNMLYAAIKKRYPSEFIRCIKRAPWNLVPFLLLMFVIVVVLEYFKLPSFLYSLIGKGAEVFKYGVVSFFACNLMNNIPMSVLFSAVTQNVPQAQRVGAVLAVTAGSNLGAFLTPFGALAGLMWQKILRGQGLSFGWRDFVRYGGRIGLPSLVAALVVLNFLV